MASIGAQPGNTNQSKGRPWAAAIARALEKRSLVEQRDALDDLAEKLLAKADEGDLEALKELGNRLDGKPAQSVALTGEEGGPVQHSVEVAIVGNLNKA